MKAETFLRQSYTDFNSSVIPDVLPIYTVEKRVSFDFINVVNPIIRITAPSER